MKLMIGITIVLVMVVFVLLILVCALRNTVAFWHHRAQKYRRMERYLIRRKLQRNSIPKSHKCNDHICTCTNDNYYANITQL